ncbi:hypothetical protein EAF00_000485 [Botryotinia globosa]|nr:hypothetical protein EAF00_000485 [Botryotinia globosa]
MNDLDLLQLLNLTRKFLKVPQYFPNTVLNRDKKKLRSWGLQTRESSMSGRRTFHISHLHKIPHQEQQ